MSNATTETAIATLLAESSAAHGEYERRALGGVYDEDWPAWYAAHLIEHGLNALLPSGAALTAALLADLLTGLDAEYTSQRPDGGWPAFYAGRLTTWRDDPPAAGSGHEAETSA